MDPLGASVSPSAKPRGRIRCRQPGTRLAPVLYLADAQTLGLMEDGLAESTHSDWLCIRCQQPRDLPSQSGSWRRTQGGRAQGSPAPERSTRLPPGSGESGGQSRLGEGATPATPQFFSPKTIGIKSLVFFQESSTQANHLLDVRSSPLVGEGGRGCSGHLSPSGATTGSVRKRGK